MHIFAVERKFMLLSQSCKMTEVLRNRLRACRYEILQHVASPNLDILKARSQFFNRVETLITILLAI